VIEQCELRRLLPWGSVVQSSVDEAKHCGLERLGHQARRVRRALSSAEARTIIS
jgi:hypothetical protein